MSNHRLAFTDTSLTDGQTAVWAGALDNRMLLAPARALSSSGLAAVEVLSPAVLDECIVRDEHPLQRVELAYRHYGSVPLRATVNLLTGHGRPGADVLGPTAIDAWLTALATAGLRQVVLLDPLLDLVRLKAALESATTAGLTAIAALPYTADDGVSDDTYAERAALLVAAGAERVMLRDESGVLTPDRAHTLLPALVATLGDTPLDLHTRCHTTLGTVVALEAGRLGVSGIDTALPSVANGASLPSLPSLVRVLRHDECYQGLPDLDGLLAADAILAGIADQEGFPAAAPWPFDLAAYIHQLPGEVAADVRSALRERGRWAELHEFAAECAAVRREMGSPPMVAPFARAIAEQSMCHFDGEQRYESLRPVLRRLLQGVYGTVDGDLRTDLQARVGSVLTSESASPTIEAELAADEDVLLAWVAGVTIAAVPRRADVGPYEALTPYENLTRGLLARAGRYATLTVSAPGFRIHLQQEG
jgi:oxaloacetate decarboxylase alpha subunit